MSIEHTASLAMQPMSCLQSLGLSRSPFPVAPDTDSFFQSPRIDALMAEVLHAILTRKGFLVLTGEIGLGKTTISRRLLFMLEANGIETALVFNTLHQGADLLAAINQDFGVADAGQSTQAQLQALNAFLLERNHQGRNCAIVMDDAQNLSAESLEMIRLISNLETESEKLVQVLLVGQPELDEKLRSHELRQLKSRIVVNVRTRPLTLAELKQYVYFKLNAAGCRGCIDIPEGTFRALFRLTEGNFRRVNILMDRCLYAACAAGLRRITRRMLAEAAAELQLTARRPAGRWALAAGVALPVLAAAALAGTLVLGRAAGGAAGMAAPPPPSPAVQDPVPAPQALPAQRGVIVPEDLRRFLELHGLAGWAERFALALREQRLDELGEALAEQTGLRLIALAEPPPQVRARFALLRTRSTAGTTRYLLLWEPQSYVESYHYKYTGEAIAELQRSLARLGLYQYTIDGVVGGQLFKALTEFQRTRGLRPTGYPDAQTQLLLSLVSAQQS